MKEIPIKTGKMFVLDSISPPKDECLFCRNKLIKDQFGFFCPNESCGSINGLVYPIDTSRLRILKDFPPSKTISPCVRITDRDLT